MRGAINTADSLTGREREEFEQEMAAAREQAEYQLKYRAMELDLKRLETRWTQVFRLPFALLSLPVRFVMALALIAYAVRKTNAPKEFWDYLGKL